MDGDLFIARVAARLRLSAAAGDTSLSSPVVPPGVEAARARPDAAESAGVSDAAPGIRERLIEMFAARLSEAGGEALQVSDRQQALSAVEDMARELGWAALSCPPSVRWPAMDELWTDDPRRADFGLSEAEWGVAETGSVVLRHAGERGRSHSLLPPVVGFLLPASRLVRGVGDVLALIDDASDPLPACVTFVTGQSHSGDIAGVTCYGVHGPARVRVWVIDDA